MKILIGILVIVLAVFLNSVESGTPLGGGFPLRPGSAPKPVGVPVPSRSRQPGRGGRQGRTQSGSAIKPAAASTAAPATTSATAPGAPQPTTTSNNEETMYETTYIEDPQRGFIKISQREGLNVALVRFNNFFIGRVQGEDILPIFDEEHHIIRIDVNQNYLKITMGKTVARRWGVFGKYADFCKKHRLAFII